ncbi:hypothetical protein Q0601_05625 [Paracoccus onubensis]|uniref:hypothetical protein n=1 Tax=Paracoccus onubensis TaxID=1675788 RepID=UPI002730DA0C|nr:hypothetical protein [Paracoccus onubensis]MDP0926639.1 hypothetical protein [Paracoccus onubensis]
MECEPGISSDVLIISGISVAGVKEGSGAASAPMGRFIADVTGTFVTLSEIFAHDSSQII